MIIKYEHAMRTKCKKGPVSRFFNLEYIKYGIIVTTAQTIFVVTSDFNHWNALQCILGIKDTRIPVVSSGPCVALSLAPSIAKRRLPYLAWCGMGLC